jgi:hypothetical protein
MLGVPEGIIEEEIDVRHVAQLQISPHFPSDQAPGALQSLLRVRPSLVLTDHTVVDARVPEIARQLHIRNGHPTNPRIFHDALDRPGDFFP